MTPMLQGPPLPGDKQHLPLQSPGHRSGNPLPRYSLITALVCKLRVKAPSSTRSYLMYLKGLVNLWQDNVGPAPIYELIICTEPPLKVREGYHSTRPCTNATPKANKAKCMKVKSINKSVTYKLLHLCHPF